jgi:GntR family transcriptional regulator
MSDLSKISGIPLYIQIRERILDNIKNKKIKEGEKLPTEQEMAQSIGVNRLTVRRAIEDLVADGLVQRVRGRGTFVLSQKMTRRNTHLTSFYEDAIERGSKPSSKLLSFSIIQATQEIADRLGINQGDQVYVVRRLRILDKKPIAVHFAYISKNLLKDLEKENLEKESLYSIYFKNNLPVRWANQRIEAHLADEELVGYLGLKIGDPLLYTEITTYTQDDIPLEYLQAFYNGATYTLEVTLIRDDHINR